MNAREREQQESRDIWNNLGALDNGKVASQYVCPRCGEIRSDWLVWSRDGVIDCKTCGYYYKPVAE